MLARIILIGPESRSASDSHLHHEIGMIRQHPVTHRHTEGGHRGNIKRGGRVTSPDYECAQNCSLMVTDRVANIRHWDDICYLYLCYRLNYLFSIGPRVMLPQQAKSEPLFIFISLAVACKPLLAFSGLGLQLGKVAPQPDRETVNQTH